jgi:hypothetical protein
MSLSLTKVVYLDKVLSLATQTMTMLMVCALMKTAYFGKVLSFAMSTTIVQLMACALMKTAYFDFPMTMVQLMALMTMTFDPHEFEP